MHGRLNLLENLRGLICLYKPADTSSKYLLSALANKLCSELNKTDNESPANCLEIESKEKTVSVNIRPSYLDNRLASGPKYDPYDISIGLSSIGARTSGVCIAGIKSGINYINELRKWNPVKVLHVNGTLGQATRFLYKDEKVVAKASFRDIKKVTIDNILSSFQAAHQRKIFIEFGIDIQSQQAYELAVKGLLRPVKGNIPTIYSVKCINYNPPNFTIEMICVRENEDYLLSFIHDLGLGLKTLAHCTGIRCIRYGPFTVPHSLLLKECTLDNVKKNMKLCNKLMNESRANKSPSHLQLLHKDESQSEENYVRSYTS